MEGAGRGGHQQPISLHQGKRADGQTIPFINIQSFNHSIKIKSYFDFIYELISFVDFHSIQYYNSIRFN